MTRRSEFGIIGRIENMAVFVPDPDGDGDAISFDDLPEEVLHSILGYMDIPSLAALSMTHKAEHDNIAYLASDDVTWYALVQSRFGIGCNHRRNIRKEKRDGVVIVKRSSSSSLSSDGGKMERKRRPTTYGGVRWKDAYRSLSSTMRIPETGITSGSQSQGGGAVFASPHLRGRHGKNSVADFFGLWCMVNHAENCRTRTVEGQMRRRRRSRRRGHQDAFREPAALPYRLDRRYIELKLCLQNTKSGFGRVVVPDITAIRFVTSEEEDYFSSYGWDKWDEDYDATFPLIEDGPWAPKMLLQRRFGYDDHALEQSSIITEMWNAKSDLNSIILRPFEVVVLSVHISCPDGLVYETDVLSSMSSIRVPVVADGWSSIGKQPCENGCNMIRSKDVSVSRFLSEDALWEYYCQLPGGCLSLTDRSRLVHV